MNLSKLSLDSEATLKRFTCWLTTTKNIKESTAIKYTGGVKQAIRAVGGSTQPLDDFTVYDKYVKPVLDITKRENWGPEVVEHRLKGLTHFCDFATTVMTSYDDAGRERYEQLKRAIASWKKIVQDELK